MAREKLTQILDLLAAFGPNWPSLLDVLSPEEKSSLRDCLQAGEWSDNAAMTCGMGLLYVPPLSASAWAKEVSAYLDGKPISQADSCLGPKARSTLFGLLDKERIFANA